VVEIRSDSRYAIGCMTDWVPKWLQNGWRTAQDHEVANPDFIHEVFRVEGHIMGLGTVRYIWVRRNENTHADMHWMSWSAQS
jgi:ribonuclease HI